MLGIQTAVQARRGALTPLPSPPLPSPRPILPSFSALARVWPQAFWGAQNWVVTAPCGAQKCTRRAYQHRDAFSVASLLLQLVSTADLQHALGVLRERHEHSAHHLPTAGDAPPCFAPPGNEEELVFNFDPVEYLARRGLAATAAHQMHR